MKKIMFSVVSVVTALLISVVMISCGGGGGGGGGSGVFGGDQGQPSGTSVYSSTQAFPNGFFTTVSPSTRAGALWVLYGDSNHALYFQNATHARTVTRVGTSNEWETGATDASYEVEITNGANGYLRFSASGYTPAQYAYNITDNELVISNTYHGTKRYTRCPNSASDPWIIR